MGICPTLSLDRGQEDFSLRRNEIDENPNLRCNCPPSESFQSTVGFHGHTVISWVLVIQAVADGPQLPLVHQRSPGRLAVSLNGPP